MSIGLIWSTALDSQCNLAAECMSQKSICSILFFLCQMPVAVPHAHLTLFNTKLDPRKRVFVIAIQNVMHQSPVAPMLGRRVWRAGARSCRVRLPALQPCFMMSESHIMGIRGWQAMLCCLLRGGLICVGLLTAAEHRLSVGCWRRFSHRGMFRAVVTTSASVDLDRQDPPYI